MVDRRRMRWTSAFYPGDYRSRLRPLHVGGQGRATACIDSAARPQGTWYGEREKLVKAVHDACMPRKSVPMRRASRPRPGASMAGRSTLAKSRCSGAAAASSGRASWTKSAMHFVKDLALPNLMLDPFFCDVLGLGTGVARFVLASATWHSRAGVQCLARLLRRLPSAGAAGQPAAGPARLFWWGTPMSD